MYPNIRAEMGRHGDNLTQLAAALGMSQNSLRWKLSGEREFTLGEIEAIAQRYNCSIDYLIQHRHSLHTRELRKEGTRR